MPYLFVTGFRREVKSIPYQPDMKRLASQIDHRRNGERGRPQAGTDRGGDDALTAAGLLGSDVSKDSAGKAIRILCVPRVFQQP